MPMLHRCNFPACVTLTLGTYCVEHQQVIRDEIEAERVQVIARDERIARELAALDEATAEHEPHV